MAASLRLKPSSPIEVTPLIRFETMEISMWNIRKNAKNQMRTGFDSIGEEPLQVRWNRRSEIVYMDLYPN